MSSYIVNSSTSLILVKKLISPYYPIYLSSLVSPDFTITIRDVTGSELIKNTPIVCSTIGGAKFANGTSQYTINNPFGLLQLRYRSSIWQPLHTSAAQPSDSAANVNTIYISTAYISVFSSITHNVSSMTIENLNITNTFNLNGSITFANISTSGNIITNSTLSVYKDVIIGNSLYVSSAGYLNSSAIFSTISSVNNLYTPSSIVFGGNMYVNNNVFITSSLILRSSYFFTQTLVAEQSTGTALYVDGLALIGNNISTPSSFVVLNSTIINDKMLVRGNISTLGSVFIGSSIYANGVINIGGNATVNSNTLFLSSVLIGGNARFYDTITSLSSFQIGGNLSSYFINTFGSVSTAGNLSSFSFVVSSITVEGSLSTTGQLLIQNTLTTAQSMYNTGSISSQNITTNGDILVNNSIQFNTLFGGNIVVGQSTTVFSNAYISSVNIVGSVNVAGSISSSTQLDMMNSYFVSTATIGGSITAFSTYFSSVNVGNFQFLQLTVPTSTIYSPVNVSTTVLSNAINYLLLISSQNYIYRTQNAFLSTIVSPIITASGGIITNVVTGKFFIGSTLTTSEYGFILSTSSEFKQGFSTQQLGLSTATADLFVGDSFYGDGSALSNIQIPQQNIRADSFFVSTLTSQTFYTSSLLISTLIVQSYMESLSSILMPNLLIQNREFPIKYSTNQLLVLSPSTFILNNTVFFDLSNRRVGIKTSTPTVSLDINGYINYNTINYSSIQSLIINGCNLTTFTSNALRTSSLLVNNSLQVSSVNGSMLFYTNNGMFLSITNNGSSSPSPFSNNTVSKNTIDFYKSSIGFNNALLNINFSSLNVGVNVVNPKYPLDILGNFKTKQLQTSSLLVQGQLSTSILQFGSSLFIYGSSTPIFETSTNQVLLYPSSLYINNLMLVDSYYNRVGIKNKFPQYALDIGGNAYMSTIQTTQSKFGFLSLGIQLL